MQCFHAHGIFHAGDDVRLPGTDPNQIRSRQNMTDRQRVSHGECFGGILIRQVILTGFRSGSVSLGARTR